MAFHNGLRFITNITDIPMPRHIRRRRREDMPTDTVSYDGSWPQQQIDGSLASVGSGREQQLPFGALELTWTDKREMPLVSVVIPSRKRPEMLERALRSVFGQSLRQLEVVVVVDGPEIETLELLQRFADRRLDVLYLHKSV